MERNCRLGNQINSIQGGYHMIKKYGLWYTIKYYFVIPYVIFALALAYADPHIVQFCSRLANVKTDELLYKVILYIVPVFLGAIWFLLVFSVTRQKRYRFLTGRNFARDNQMYHRTYRELVRYFKDANPYKMELDDYKKQSWKDAEGIILGKAEDKLIHVETAKDGKNYFIFGLPSTGKTAGPIICSCLRWGMHHPLSENHKETDGSIFCIDLKGDIARATHKYRNIVTFNLMDPKNSAHYNPFAGIENLSIDERCNFIENIGFNLIPAAGGESGKYFTETAYDYWNGIALYLLHKDINTSFPDVIEAILTGNPIDWVKKVVSSDCAEAKRRLQSKWGENEKNLSGGYSNLAQNCRKFASNTLYFLLGNDPQYEYISVQTLEEGKDVYVQLDQAELMNYNCLLSMIVQGFLNGFLQREKNPFASRLNDGTLRPIAFILDEFAQLSTLKYETLATAFMTLRSRNISIICALQSRSSITEMFHSEAACMSLIDCVTTFVFLSIQEVQTREWASKLIGNQKVLRIANSISNERQGHQNTSRSVQETIEPIFQPADFGNLIDEKNGRDELIIYSKGRYVKANKIYYYKKE